MRKSRFNEEQIIAILKEAEAGIAPDELCRRHGITRGSLYRWKAKYGGMEVSEARRLRQLEEENRQLKHIVAELLLDKRALQAVVTKSGRPADAARGSAGDAGGSGAEPAARLRADEGTSGDLPVSAANLDENIAWRESPAPWRAGTWRNWRGHDSSFIRFQGRRVEHGNGTSARRTETDVLRGRGPAARAGDHADGLYRNGSDAAIYGICWEPAHRFIWRSRNGDVGNQAEAGHLRMLNFPEADFWPGITNVPWSGQVASNFRHANGRQDAEDR